jgi:hypothetical protein
MRGHIESAPQVVQDISGNVGEFWRMRLFEPNFVDFVFRFVRIGSIKRSYGFALSYSAIFRCNSA